MPSSSPATTPKGVRTHLATIDGRPVGSSWVLRLRGVSAQMIADQLTSQTGSRWTRDRVRTRIVNTLRTIKEAA